MKVLLSLTLLCVFQLITTGNTSQDARKRTKKIAAKHILRPAPFTDIEVRENENEFPEIDYPTSVFDIGKSFYFNPSVYESEKAKVNTGESAVAVGENCFANYKIKQRLRAMTNAFAKATNSYEFEDIKPKKIPYRGISPEDKIRIHKLLNKRPCQLNHGDTCSTLPKTPILQLDPKWLPKKAQSLTQSTSTNGAQNNRAICEYEASTQEVIDSLIHITDQIFDTVVAYTNEKINTNLLTPDETTEIVRVIENIKEVLGILDYLSNNATIMTFDNTITDKEQINNEDSLTDSVELNETSSSSEWPRLNKIYHKDTDLVPMIKDVDEALTGIGKALNNTIPCACTKGVPEETYELISVVENLKEVIDIIEDIDTNVTSSLPQDTHTDLNSTETNGGHTEKAEHTKKDNVDVPHLNENVKKSNVKRTNKRKSKRSNDAVHELKTGRYLNN